MANSYTQFSTQIEGSVSDIAALVALLKEGALKADEDWEDGYQESGWEAEAGDQSIWFHSDEYENIEALANIIARWQTEQGITTMFQMQWADTCSKPRLDEFGGGALIVYKGEAHWLSTTRWLMEESAKLLN